MSTDMNASVRLNVDTLENAQSFILGSLVRFRHTICGTIRTREKLSRAERKLEVCQILKIKTSLADRTRIGSARQAASRHRFERNDCRGDCQSHCTFQKWQYVKRVVQQGVGEFEVIRLILLRTSSTVHSPLVDLNHPALYAEGCAVV